jgi:K+ transporter
MLIADYIAIIVLLALIGVAAALSERKSTSVISVLSAEEGHDYRDNRADHH